jgi:hypothetical protein
MDEDREKQRQTYQICRLGFALLSLTLGLACFSMIVQLSGFFVDVRWITQTPVWRWLGAPIVWGSLLGAYLLWGRWSDSGWQARTGLLLLMCVVDAFLWLLEHGDEMGLRLTNVGHEWLRVVIGEALSWPEFALIASLACDLLAHLGVEQARDAGKATRSLAATGAVVWFLFFLEQTVWRAGWPLQRRGIDSLNALLLFFGFTMIWIIILIQVTALTLAASRQAARAVREMDAEEAEHDLLKPPSEREFDLLSTHRDSTQDDDNQYRPPRTGW